MRPETRPATRSRERPVKLRGPASGLLPENFQRGVCLVGTPSEEELRRLVRVGVTWISITPFGYGQREATRVPDGGYRPSRYRGESLGAMREHARLAHKLGLSVLLKPHLWFTRGGKWRGDIRFDSAEDWRAFYEAYRDFLLPYLRMAEKQKIEAFCLGTELPGTTSNEEMWRKLIRDARKIYKGKLGYGAHWWDESEKIRFWDALDWIGVQAYFPLVDQGEKEASKEQLLRGWKPWMDRLGRLAKISKRPILITELGYKPRVGTAHRPWEWNSKSAFSEKAQARAYEAFFEAVQKAPFIHGVHIWKWFTWRRRRHQDFSPQGLEAEKVLRHWFRGQRDQDRAP